MSCGVPITQRYLSAASQGLGQLAMISVIICSRDADLPDDLRRNIEETIGLAHELVVIDNSRREHSLCEAYNLGVKRSHHEILCFMHDDIRYRSDSWGATAAAHFRDQSVGMIGVGGSRYLSRIPSIWWASGIGMMGDAKGTICHNSIDTDPIALWDSKRRVINPAQSVAEDVVVLDGLWFCIRRDLFGAISFDAATYDGFHFYDLDISLQVGQTKKRLQVVYDLTVEHVSHSRHDRSWIAACFMFYEKWAPFLPLATVVYEPGTLARIELDNLRVFLEILKGNGYLLRGLGKLARSHFLTLARYAVVYDWSSLYWARRCSSRS